MIVNRSLAQKESAFSRNLSIVPSQKILVGIMVVAALLRVGSAIYQGNVVTPLPGIYDQIAYDSLARRILAGHGFSFAEGYWPLTQANAPTAHWSYLYTLYLAAVYGLFGETPIIARLLQAVIAGILHSWLVWRIGRRVFNEVTGIIAAALSAVYIYFFYYGGALITETFYILGLLWTIDIALRLGANDRGPGQASAGPMRYWRLWGELGLAIGITVLLRQLFLLFVPFLFLWIWWNGSRTKNTRAGVCQRPVIFDWPVLRGLTLATLIVVMLIVPWTIRNYRAFGTLVPLNTNAGFAFFWGNHPIYGTRFVGILPDDGPTYLDLIPMELRHLNEAELDRALLREGINFVTDDPMRYVLLSMSRTREYFKFWPSTESGLISNVARVGSFGLALPLMLYGLGISLLCLRHSERPHQRSALVLLYLFIAVYTGIHLLTWALIRYRLPVDAVLLLFAAGGLASLGQRFTRPRSTVEAV